MNSLNTIQDINTFLGAETLYNQVTVADLTYANVTFFHTRMYNMYALLLMDNKCGEVIRDNQVVEYSERSLITIRPGQTLGVILDYDIKPKGLILAFKAELLEKTGLGRDFYMFSYFNMNYNDAIALNEIEYKVIRNCYTNLHAELHTPKDHLSGQMIRLGIGTLLSYVKRYFEQQHIDLVKRSETLSNRLDSLLDKYLGSGQPAQMGLPSVKWCASQLNMSPNNFAEQIKKDMHVTAQEYIKNKMIAHAQVLLRQTNMTINEIAEELGFKYPNHFTRMFHSSTGYTPLKYRKEN